uniref:hypothetical protein n=1 Tax=Pantoea sp. IMH TaxID=1267600 RepID=UPI000469B502|nr:hypothetical protein [Pantoea sp. IMH]
MTLHQQATTTQKVCETIIWLVVFIPLALLAVFFFATTGGVSMWVGGGMSVVFAFGFTQRWWRKINN